MNKIRLPFEISKYSAYITGMHSEIHEEKLA
jgi:hypothetical protein